MPHPFVVVPLALAQAVTGLAATAVVLSASQRPATPPSSATVIRAVDPVPPQPLPVSLPPAAAVRAQARVAPQPLPVRRQPAHHAAPRRTVPHVSTPALPFGTRLMQAVARIPGYQPGLAVWLVSSSYGHWGTADLNHGIVYISPSVPANRLYDVAVHEWSHVLSMHDYDYDVQTAIDAMNGYFGGSGIEGAERAADCMARELGAQWTHYTPCSDAHWRAGARRLVAGQRL